MKIGVLSDLHIDGNALALQEATSFVDLIANMVHKEQVDHLLIAGDISNDYVQSLNFLTELEQAARCKVLFVPGNHDYWSKINGEERTQKIYEAFKQDCTSILEKPYLLNDEWAIVGNTGWYDYSFGSSEFSTDDFNRMSYLERTWQDKLYVHWGRTNQDMHQWFYNKIEQDLQAVGNRKIILITHMVTHPEFIVPMPNEMFAYFNAFIGSSMYEQLIEKYPINYSIMGHIHYRKRMMISQTEYICACLGNKNEWKTTDVEQEIQDAFMTFEI